MYDSGVHRPFLGVGEYCGLAKVRYVVEMW